jgi:TetR/AcrR family transcriptional regulator, cholesterol catabolism regulator
VAGDVGNTVTRALTKDQRIRRVRLIEAARELADEGGYAAVTMHDVADRAGVARATVYRYFVSKDHLLTEVAAAWARTVTADVATLNPHGTAVERLTTLLEHIIEVAAAELRLTSAIVQGVTSGDPGVEESRTALFMLVRERLAAAMGDPVPERADIEIVLGHVLLAALVSLTALAQPVGEVRAMVATAARLILGGL